MKNDYGLSESLREVNICTFAAIDSKSIAIVILEGNAWGLMIRSGLMPVFAENGMSMSGHNWEQTPFCPCRLLNLSPIIGFLTRRRRMFACKRSSSETYDKITKTNSEQLESEILAFLKLTAQNAIWVQDKLQGCYAILRTIEHPQHLCHCSDNFQPMEILLDMTWTLAYLLQATFWTRPIDSNIVNKCWFCAF